jgi:hypothetical protein
MTSDETVRAVGAHLFSDPGAKVYAVLDGASIEDLLPKLYGLKPEHACLYRGELEPDLQETAPYLVRLEPGAPFTHWVLGEGWGKHWGIFVRTGEDLKLMHRHFRKFLRVQDSKGKTLLFRYYDPRVLRVYLPTCNAGETEMFFGPVKAFMMEGENPSDLLRFVPTPEGPQLETKKVAATP